LCNGGTCVNAPDVRPCRDAAKSKLLIVDGDDDRDKLLWKWLRGASTSQPEFADPSATASYRLCLFAGTSAVLAAAEIGADPQTWSGIGDTAFIYDDADASEGGIRKILLRSSAADRTKIVVNGKGANLPDVHPPLALPIIVQLLNTETDVCWGSTYTAADPNQTGRFKARAP
jgi:hypothetical protein